MLIGRARPIYDRLACFCAWLAGTGHATVPSLLAGGKGKGGKQGGARAITALGHSQGVVAAAAVAVAASGVAPLADVGEGLVRYLFWHGLRAQLAARARRQAAEQRAGGGGKGGRARRGSRTGAGGGGGKVGTDEPKPGGTPMLAVRGLRPRELRSALRASARARAANAGKKKHGPDGSNESTSSPEARAAARARAAREDPCVALVNGPRNCVVSGPPHLLATLPLELKARFGPKRRRRRKKGAGPAPPPVPEARTPFSRRARNVSTRALRVTAPFHHPANAGAARRVLADCARLGLRVPARRTYPHITHSSTWHTMHFTAFYL